LRLKSKRGSGSGKSLLQGYLAHKKHPPLPGPPCRGQTNRTETSPRPHLTGVPRTPRKGNLLILLAHKNTHPSKTLPQAFDEGRTSVRVEQQRVRVEQHLATRTHPRAGIRVEHAGQISAHPQGGTHPSRTLPQGCVLGPAPQDPRPPTYCSDLLSPTPEPTQSRDMGPVQVP
jgi:hypothetical protein